MQGLLPQRPFLNVRIQVCTTKFLARIRGISYNNANICRSSTIFKTILEGWL